MHVRIAVDLARRRLKNLRLGPLGEPEHIDGAVHAGLGCLYRIELVMDRGSGTREVVDLVDLDMQGKRDVVTRELEAGVVEQRQHVVARAGEEVVDAKNVMAALEQALTQMRSEETGTARHENPSSGQVLHRSSPPITNGG